MMAIYVLSCVGIMAFTIALLIYTESVTNDRVWTVTSLVLCAIATAAFVAAVVIAQVE